MMYKPK